MRLDEFEKNMIATAESSDTHVQQLMLDLSSSQEQLQRREVEIADALKNNGGLQEEVTKLTNDLFNFEHQLNSLKSEHPNISGKNAQLEAKVSMLNQEKIDLVAKVEKLNEQKIELMKSNDLSGSLSSKIIELEASNSSMKEMNAQKDDALNEKCEEILSLRASLDDRKSLLLEQTSIINELQAAHDHAKEEICSFTGRLATKDDVLAELRNCLKSSEDKLSVSAETIVRLEGELLTVLESNETQSDARIQSLLTNIEELQARLGNYANELDTAQSEAKAWKGLLEQEKTSGKDTLQREIDAREENKLALQEQLEETKSILDASETENRTIRRDMQDVAERFSKSQTEIKHLREQVTRVASVETECYQARQEIEDLMDENAYLKTQLKSSSALSSEEFELAKKRICSLEELNDSLKNEVKAAQNQLGMMTKDHERVQLDMESKMHETEELRKNRKFAEAQAADARNEASRAREEYLEVSREADHAREELGELQQKYDELAAESDDVNVTVASELVSLKAEIASMQKSIMEKDARIKKLDAAKLTKDQLKYFNKLKTEHKQYQKDCKKSKEKLLIAEEEIGRLREEVSNWTRQSSSSADKENSGVSSGRTSRDAQIKVLLASKEALETKLRKYAIHCQRFEQDKEAIMDTLKNLPTTDHSIRVEEDFVGAVTQLVQQLRDAEEECEAMGSAEERATGYLMELDRLRETNSLLEESMASTQHRVSELIASNEKNSDTLLKAENQISQLVDEKVKLKERAESAQGNATDLQSENGRKIRFLEKENLRLLVEIKNIRKQCQQLKLELENARLGLGDECDTQDLGGVSLDFSMSTPMGKLLAAEKENHPNAALTRSAVKFSTSKKLKKKSKVSMTPKRLALNAVGLGGGENTETDESNVESCNQS